MHCLRALNEFKCNFDILPPIGHVDHPFFTTLVHDSTCSEYETISLGYFTEFVDALGRHRLGPTLNEDAVEFGDFASVVEVIADVFFGENGDLSRGGKFDVEWFGGRGRAGEEGVFLAAFEDILLHGGPLFTVELENDSCVGVADYFAPDVTLVGIQYIDFFICAEYYLFINKSFIKLE